MKHDKIPLKSFENPLESHRIPLKCPFLHCEKPTVFSRLPNQGNYISTYHEPDRLLGGRPGDARHNAGLPAQRGSPAPKSWKLGLKAQKMMDG